MKVNNTFVFPVVRRDFIFAALDTLREHTPRNYRTVVVDQTQPDAEFEAGLRKRCDLWLKTKKNYGFAQAANLGIRVAPTEYVTVCNDDVEFVWSGWWLGIVETFRRFETAACVNPMSPREPGWGYGEPGFREYLTYEESHDERKIVDLVESRNGQVVDAITCWCTTFRAEMLEEIGLFDERFWPGGGEDYDLDARIYKAGYRALGTSLSWIWHWWGQSKDEGEGLNAALPPAREYWNRLGELWPEEFDQWGKSPEDGHLLPRDETVAKMGL